MVPAYLNRGIDYGIKGDLDRAIADYDKAIQLNPTFAFAYNDRGNAYQAKGDLNRAIAHGKATQGLPDVEKSLELSPYEPLALDTRGHIFAALGRREEAIADFQRALAKAPQLQSSRDALRGLGASP